MGYYDYFGFFKNDAERFLTRLSPVRAETDSRVGIRGIDAAALALFTKGSRNFARVPQRMVRAIKYEDIILFFVYFFSVRL